VFVCCGGVGLFLALPHILYIGGFGLLFKNYPSDVYVIEILANTQPVTILGGLFSSYFNAYVTIYF